VNLVNCFFTDRSGLRSDQGCLWSGGQIHCLHTSAARRAFNGGLGLPCGRSGAWKSDE